MDNDDNDCDKIVMIVIHGNDDDNMVMIVIHGNDDDKMVISYDGDSGNVVCDSTDHGGIIIWSGPGG